ncbi:MAG TPA: HslU--HslV peptidase ATPase subunit [Clostridiales bacterium]|nr:HslU--HslV peptidase ATPase subunit [Clostridiales bacterium]
MNLTPKEIVAELDKYIIGQEEAKKAVAVALRNRYRRSKLSAQEREDIMPKNIILKGPTGVGKTEIARRLAKLVNAPFVKIEATKFTEVGYVGRDCESMIRDLIDVAVRMVKDEKLKAVKSKVERIVNEKLFNIIYPNKKIEGVDENLDRQRIMAELQQGNYDAEYIEIDVKEQPKNIEMLSTGNAEISLGSIFDGMFPGRKKRRKVTIKEAKQIIADEESEKLLDLDGVNAEAIERVEQEGIIFIDEIDKIASKENSKGPDVSREGVQRDLLPFVEGTSVTTKYGVVKTDYILFMAAGAFHVSKVDDLIPELQGRFPIRVELDNLTKADFVRILTEPKNATIKQYQSLLKVDKVDLKFTNDALEEIAELAEEQNLTSENIGARRLNTILEKVLEDINYEASGDIEKEVVVDKAFVEKAMSKLIKSKDLKKYIL